MKFRSKGLIFLSFLFLIYGCFWLSSIYLRGEKIFSKEGSYWTRYKISSIDYILLKEEMGQMLNRQSFKQGFDSITIRKMNIQLFWFIVYIEFLCSIAYILAGISLIRLYPFARTLSICTLYLDTVLKVLISTHVQYLSIPLSQILNKKSILFSYYVPDNSFGSYLSLYLTGLKMYQADGGLYLFLYIITIFCCFFYLTREEVKHQFIK